MKDISDWDLSDDERAVLDTLNEICRREILPVRQQLDENEEFPAQILARLREANVFEAMFDADCGGLGLSPLMPFRITETLARYCVGVATTFAATTSLAATPIRLVGTPHQKAEYLPKLVSGEWSGAFAVTEPGAGSDILALRTTAVKAGDTYVLNGTKQWITNAGKADLYCIFARTGGGQGGLSCFVVLADTPGLSFGKLENKLGIRCSHTRQVVLEDVVVPACQLIGGKPNRGLLLLFQTLARSRIVVATLGVGLARAAYDEAVAYTREREQFGQRVIRAQVVQHMLVDMLISIETARHLTYHAARASACGHPEVATLAAMAKVSASEVAMQVATDALQLHGGYGYVKESPIEKMFRDAKVLAIYEGTNQLLKNQIGDFVMRRG